MKEDKLFELYEKLYFHEIEMREKLNGRLQLPLAILISLLGFLAFMLRNLEILSLNLNSVIFILFYLASFFFILASIQNFIRSWYGYEYAFLPSAEDTENYRKKLIGTYEDYDECDNLVTKYFSEYLQRYYIECSSKNTINNDKRSVHIHKMNKHIITGGIFALGAFFPFYFGQLDKNEHNKVYEIRINHPILLKGFEMPEENSKKNPPAPPPPPPKRIIKEGVESNPPKRDQNNKGRD